MIGPMASPILLVEDDRLKANAIVRTVGRLAPALTVHWTASSVAGRRALEDGNYSAVISDWNLPMREGQAIRHGPNWPKGGALVLIDAIYVLKDHKRICVISGNLPPESFGKDFAGIQWILSDHMVDGLGEWLKGWYGDWSGRWHSNAFQST